eukprot:CAMPEP_0174975654 /NCGR_PEP_ID=MMETSP0004_2-20121128/12567_1 /TAXON_ID=420556 /ORGANISM="Ochromonas sp., Strain CCMP1393" /LENGTH=229 /DNA_ID=CAMNT_0016226537 /DNA_START=58 /DNA_END=747 /DNA_ORIENTATION=-
MAVSAFHSPLMRAARTSHPTMQMISGNRFSKAVGVGLLSFTLSQGIVNNDLSFHSAIPPAVADVRAQQKRTYFRFAPKLVEGTAFYKNDLKQAIDKKDYAVVSKFFEEYVTKVNKQDPGQVDTDTYVNQHFFRPMTLLSGTFAERGTSSKTRLLQEQQENFATAMKSLEGCTKNMKGEGFFAPDIKMPTGGARDKQANEAWKAGKEALNAYLGIFNDGLMLELNKLETI